MKKKETADIMAGLNRLMMSINDYCTIQHDRETETAGGSVIRETRYLDPATGLGCIVERLNGQTTRIELLI